MTRIKSTKDPLHASFFTWLKMVHQVNHASKQRLLVLNARWTASWVKDVLERGNKWHRFTLNYLIQLVARRLIKLRHVERANYMAKAARKALVTALKEKDILENDPGPKTIPNEGDVLATRLKRLVAFLSKLSAAWRDKEDDGTVNNMLYSIDDLLLKLKNEKELGVPTIPVNEQGNELDELVREKNSLAFKHDRESLMKFAMLEFRIGILEIERGDMRNAAWSAESAFNCIKKLLETN